MLGATPHGYAGKNGSDLIADISGTNMVRDASLNSLEEDILVFPLLHDAEYNIITLKRDFLLFSKP